MRDVITLGIDAKLKLKAAPQLGQPVEGVISADTKNGIGDGATVLTTPVLAIWPIGFTLWLVKTYNGVYLCSIG